MKTPFFLKLALRYLGWGKGAAQSNARKSLFGAAFGIGLSIIPLIVVPILSDGMIHGITSRMVELGSGHIRLLDTHFSPSEAQGTLNEHPTYIYRQHLKDYTGNENITHVRMELSGSGLIVSKKARVGGAVRAVEPDFFTADTAVSELITIVDGSVDLSDARSLVLGKKIAEDLKLSVGDSCRLLMMYENDHGKTVPKIVPFKVKGIVSSGYQILDGLWVFIPLETGVKKLSRCLSDTALTVSIDNPFNQNQLDTVVADIIYKAPPGFTVMTWQDANRSQFYSFKTTKNLLLFILFLIVLAAAANIASAIVMLVMERQKEIAILKTLGHSPFELVISFLSAGIITALMGIIIALPIALLLALNINGVFKRIEQILNFFKYHLFSNDLVALPIELLNPEYYLESIPTVVDISQLILIIIATLVLSAIVCIIPALKASNLKPLNIMRKN